MSIYQKPPVVIDVPQGSTFWHEARHGRLTASRAGDVMAKPTTIRFQNYAQEMMWALTGVPDMRPEETPEWLEHGKRWEDKARRLYGYLRDVTPEQVGLLIDGDRNHISASPDALVNDDPTGLPGCVEIKCHKSEDEYQRDQRLVARQQHYPQMMQTAHVCRVTWCDHVSFFQRDDDDPHPLISVHRFIRDAEYITKLDEAYDNFWELVNDMANHLRDAFEVAA